jgi:hypothetical protein
MLDGFLVLLGVEFSFSDRRSPIRLGLFETNPRRETIRVDFPIDGPGGERITSIDRLYKPGHGLELLDGLQVIRLSLTPSRTRLAMLITETGRSQRITAGPLRRFFGRIVHQ